MKRLTIALSSIAALSLFSLNGSTAKAQTGAVSRYYPLPPCRIVDTRSTFGNLSPGIPTTFLVNRGPAYDYRSQGGSIVGCGIPSTARSVFFNIVVVTPTSSGFVRAWPSGTSIPNASILNFSNLPGLNQANGVVLPVCEPFVSSCTTDLNVQIDQSPAALVIDILGYYL
jgi:hypothetical protein